MIPVLDLVEQYRRLKIHIDAAVNDVFAGGSFINGPNVHEFEKEFAQYIGARHAVGLNSGTDALYLALRALDIGMEDEVITTGFSFVATSEAIALTGAVPVFVDIDPVTYNIDPLKIEAAITPRTRAILPVHLYGTPAAMEAIVEIATRHALPVVEDCAQAVGAEINERKVGTFGITGCFSFFPSKNLGAYGDGGMLTTDSSDIADRVRSLRAHGGRKKYYHEELGVNSRLDEVQAAILRVKLPYLEGWTLARRRIAKQYDLSLRHLAEITTPVEPPETRCVYHQYTVRCRHRDDMQRSLESAGVQTMVYYPKPLHLQDVYHHLGYREGSLPECERAAREVLSLPMFPELSEQQQSIVCQVVSRYQPAQVSV